MGERPLAAAMVDALRALVGWLEAAEVPGVVIGGVAASLLGRPRATGDIDALVLVEETAWEAFVAAAVPFGIRPRRKDALAFARQTRVLLLRHTPTATDLDVTIGTLAFERDAVTRRRRHRIGSLSVPVITPEDLIVMKTIAHRPRDLADIEGLRDTHSRLDRVRILRLVREFATTLDAPDLVTDVERILGSPRSPKRATRPKPSGRRR